MQNLTIELDWNGHNVQMINEILYKSSLIEILDVPCDFTMIEFLNSVRFFKFRQNHWYLYVILIDYVNL